MVRDEKTKMCYRADHVLKGHLQALIAKPETTEAQRKEMAIALARVDDLDQAGLTAAIRHWGAKSPDTGNDITDPAPFNLMFISPLPPFSPLWQFLTKSSPGSGSKPRSVRSVIWSVS